MGVTYKLQPEVKDFILNQKKCNPTLSCRKISGLILNKFQVNVSKSSINFIIKEAGLSMPVGRRQERKKGGLNPEIRIDLKRNLALPMKTLFLEKVEETTVEKIPESEVPEVVQGPQVIPVEEPKIEPVVEPVEAPVVQPGPIPLEEPAPSPEDKPIEPVQEEPLPKPVEEVIEAPVDKSVEKPQPKEEPTIKIDIEEPSEGPCSGGILLKAADCLTGGTHYITEAVKSRLNSPSPELLVKTEFLLYNRLKSECGVEGLVNCKFSLEEISSYLSSLQSVTVLSSDIFKVITTVFQEVRYIKVTLSDNSVFYLDGQLHTIWSTPSIPYDFSTTIYNTRSYIDRHFLKNAPLVLFMAPGYDIPTEEFFHFILTQKDGQETVERLTLCGHKFEELDGIGLDKIKRQLLVFGLWPWQFVEYRKVNKIGEFKPFRFETLGKDFYLAEIEIDLSQPIAGKTVTLSGCALKTSLSEKTRLIILSNFSEEKVDLEDLATIYLSRWPNLEEGFKDFSRKIELFTYTADSQRVFSTESTNLLVNQESLQDIGSLFDYYLKALDLYAKWYFMPSGFEEKDFSTLNECFYGLKANARRQKGLIRIAFQPPEAYPCSRELDYVCRRINEKEIILPEGRRLWLSL